MPILCTPYEFYFGSKPSLGHLRPFGCNIWVHVPDEKRTKFESKTKHHIMLGYVERATIIWRVWDPESQRQTVATNCVFDESSFGISNERDSVSAVVPDLKAAKALSPAAQVLPKSTALVGRYSKMKSLEPTSYKDAISSKNRYEWQHAIGESIRSAHG